MCALNYPLNYIDSRTKQTENKKKHFYVEKENNYGSLSAEFQPAAGFG